MQRTREQWDASYARFPEWYAVSFDPPQASKRAMALSHASARRELWRQHRAMSTKDLRAELAMHRFHLSDYCRPFRSEHLRGVSRWYVRMIETELRRRGASGMLTGTNAQS